MHRCAACACKTSFINPFLNGLAMCPQCLKTRCVTETTVLRRYRLDNAVVATLPRWVTSSQYHAVVHRYDKVAVEELAVARHGTADPNTIRAQARANELAVAAEGLPPAFVAWWMRRKHRARGMKSGHTRFVQFEKLVARTLETTEMETEINEDRCSYVVHNDETALRRMVVRAMTDAERLDAARKQRRADLVAALTERGIELPSNCVMCDEFITNGKY